MSALSVLTAIFVWAYSEDWTVHAHEFGTPMGGFSGLAKFLALALAIAWPIISVLVFVLRSFYRIKVRARVPGEQGAQGDRLRLQL